MIFLLKLKVQYSVLQKVERLLKCVSSCPSVRLFRTGVSHREDTGSSLGAVKFSRVMTFGTGVFVSPRFGGILRQVFSRFSQRFAVGEVVRFF